MKHKFLALPCISNQVGHTVRPYELDGEVIYEMDLNLLLQDEAMGEKTQVTNLANAISEKLGVPINPENLVGYLNERCIETQD